MDLPPSNPEDILRTDLQRPRVVIAGVTVKDMYLAMTESAGNAPEHRERPHGGEPAARVLLASGGQVLTSSDSSYRLGMLIPVGPHQPWLNAASDDVEDYIKTGQRRPFTIRASDYNPKSTQGILHKQHKDRNVQLPRK